MIVVLVYDSFVPLGLSLGSPTINVVFSVTSRLNDSSSRWRRVPGVPSDDFEGDENPSDVLDGDENPSDVLDGDENPSDVFEGEFDEKRVVVVVVVFDVVGVDSCCFNGDRSRLVVSTVMLEVFFSLSGLRIGTVGSPTNKNIRTLF